MRVINVAAAQMGPIQRAESRQTVIPRMLALMDEAKARGADLIVYPELALTTFSHAGTSRTRRRSMPGLSGRCRMQRRCRCFPALPNMKWR